MPFIDHNKQYRLMLPIFNEMALKLWRCQENKPLNKLLDDFISEHAKPEVRASPSPQGASQQPSINKEEFGQKPP